MRRVWLLNLDAERELARAGSYETPKRLREQIAREAKKIQEALCTGEAVLLDETLTQGTQAVAIPWCPTPNALRAVRRAQLRVPQAPPIDVLRRVNHRRFALEVAASSALARIYQDLPPELGASSLFEAERRFVTLGSPEADDLSWLEVPPAIGRGYRLKRAYGFAGKGQHRILAKLRDDDRKWIREALDAGGFLVEPEVTLTGELSLHGLVDEAGVLMGEPCELVCDQFGAPVAIRRASADVAEPATLQAFEAAGDALAEALRAAGYFGAFGLDARRFESARGPGLTLIGDVNARFTMGWSIGLGERREAALVRLTSRRE